MSKYAVVHEPTNAEEAIFDRIEEVFRTMKWPVKRPAIDLTRGNVVSNGYDEIRAFALGKVRRYDLPRELVESQYNAKYPELYALIKQLMRLHDPGFRYNAIQLNAGVKTKPHFDRNNRGRSYCLAVGKFHGGGLDLYTDGGDRPTETIRNRRRWVLYDGANVKHGSAPVTSGTRYAIIYYKATPHAKSAAPGSASKKRSKSARRRRPASR